MPRENIEIVQEALEAWGRRDGAALRELLHERAEFRSAIVGGIEGGVYRGQEDIERNFADLDDAFDDWHTEDERCLDVGGDKVVLLYRIVGKGKGSGVPIDQPVGIVFTLRDGRVMVAEAHLNPQDALKAGLQHTFEAFGQGDVDAAVDNLEPDIEWQHQLGSGAPEEGVYRGRQEVGRLMERVRDAWDDIRVEIREVAEDGEEKYVAQAIIRARGRTSGVELESACEYAIEFRDGKAVRARFALTEPAPRETLKEPPDGG